MPNQKFKKRGRNSEAMWAYLLLAPLLIGILIFFYGGMLYSLLVSFTDYNPIRRSGQIVWFANYQTALADPLLQKSIFNTLRYVLFCVPLLIGFSVFAAVLIFELKSLRLQRLAKFFFFLPNITLPVAISLVWKYMFNPVFGLINWVLRSLSLGEVEWFSSSLPAFWMIVLFVVWQGSGYCILVLTVAIQNIPKMYLEAGKIEGASFFQGLRYITLPLISGSIFFLVITLSIGLFQIFDPIAVITNGGPLDSTRSLMFAIYNQIGSLKIGLASATSWILFVMIIVVTLLQAKGQKKWVHYEM